VSVRVLPRLVVTGASGFVGRNLLEAIRDRFSIVAIGRRSPSRVGAPIHPNITWHQLDIADMRPLAAVFAQLRAGGGADLLVHLAAHYDFTGEDHPDYQRTNVDGLRHVLELSRNLGLKRFIFASSVAACRFPRPGSAIDESAPADGEHIYARTKRLGEAMVVQYGESFPTCIVRLAALFSDWCEYPPLYMFLRTWLGRAWNSRMLGGHGESAVPYLHVHDAVAAVEKLLAEPDLAAPGEVFVVSPDGATSHRELYEMATRLEFGRLGVPILVPKNLCWVGTRLRTSLARFTGEQPFERPWMARYIDKRLTVDASRTRGRLSWHPRPRLEILRRLAFLLENHKSHPVEWDRLNLQAMRFEAVQTNLRIYDLLERHQDEICHALAEQLVSPRRGPRFPRYEAIPGHEHEWYSRLLLHSLMNTVRMRESALFMSHCRDLAERRMAQGFEAEEVVHALTTLNAICLQVLAPLSTPLRPEDVDAQISAAVQFGIDAVEDVFERTPHELPADR